MRSDNLLIVEVRSGVLGLELGPVDKETGGQGVEELPRERKRGHSAEGLYEEQLPSNIPEEHLAKQELSIAKGDCCARAVGDDLMEIVDK